MSVAKWYAWPGMQAFEIAPFVRAGTDGQERLGHLKLWCEHSVGIGCH
jgi:hypothetical protein